MFVNESLGKTDEIDCEWHSVSFFFHTGIKTKINLPNDLHVGNLIFPESPSFLYHAVTNVLKMILARASVDQRVEDRGRR